MARRHRRPFLRTRGRRRTAFRRLACPGPYQPAGPMHLKRVRGARCEVRRPGCGVRGGGKRADAAEPTLPVKIVAMAIDAVLGIDLPALPHVALEVRRVLPERIIESLHVDRFASE